MPYSNFGDDNLHHVAAPMFDPDQSLQPWYSLVAPSLSLAQRDIPNFFDASDDLINNISYDFRTYDSMTAGASQPEPAVVPLASSSSSNAVFPLEQSGSWIIPVQPLEIAQLSPLKPPPYAFQTAAAFPELPSEPFLNATLTSASSSNALSGPDYENGTHMWSAPFFEGGKYKRQCTLCNKSVKYDDGTLNRHERSMRHQARLPKTKRLDNPPLKCSICGKIFKSRRRSALLRHMNICH